MPKGTIPTKPKENVPYGLEPVVSSVKSAYAASVSAFKQAGNFISDVFKNSPSPTFTNQQFGPKTPPFHQVKEGDTMDGVASQYGVPLNQLTELNQSKTLPPKGSYIQLTPRQQALMNQGVPPSVLAQIAQSPNRPFTMPGQPNRGDPAAQNLRNQANAIMQQIASGQPPNQIPAGLLGFIKDKNGQPLTLQTALQLGYVMNAQGILVNSGGPGGLKGPSPEFAATAGYQANMNKDFVNQITYINGKRMTVGQALQRGLLDIKTGRRFNSPMKRNKQGKLVSANRGGGGAPAPAPVTNIPMAQSTETPQTILDIHLGSG